MGGVTKLMLCTVFSMSLQLGIYTSFREVLQVKTFVFVETSGELGAEIMFSTQVVRDILSRMVLNFKVYHIGLGIERLADISQALECIASTAGSYVFKVLQHTAERRKEKHLSLHITSHLFNLLDSTDVKDEINLKIAKEATDCELLTSMDPDALLGCDCVLALEETQTVLITTSHPTREDLGR